MDGFTIICHECQTQSEFEKQDERLTESIKIFICNHTEIRIHCSECGQNRVLK